MDYGHSEAVALPTAYKIVIAGGFGVGKTTLVGAVSEIQPFFTEEILTDASVGVDDTSGVEAKTTTTVALDFGRISIGEDLMLYLFGTPGQDRFLFVWDELVSGAIGAVVVADTRRLEESWGSIDYFEQRGTPFVVAVNCFDGTRTYDTEEVKAALSLDPAVPVRHCDARRRESVKTVLITLMEHLLASRAPVVL
ncbi:MAG: ATP-binding protein [Hamadaea sp.]|nr:ATP-binding protein [Hamadaea sp.]